MTPVSGKLDIGTLPGERLPAQYDNWYKKWAGDWLQYLSDAAFQGATSFDTTVTMGANQHVIVSGTGAHKRGTRMRHIPLLAGFQLSGTAMTFGATDDAAGSTATNNVFRIPILVDEGERITLVQSRVQVNAGANTIVLKIYKDDQTGATPSRSQLGSTATSVGSGATLETLTSGALTEQVGSTFIQYFAEYTVTAFAGAGSNMFGIYVTTDIP